MSNSKKFFMFGFCEFLYFHFHRFLLKMLKTSSALLFKLWEFWLQKVNVDKSANDRRGPESNQKRHFHYSSNKREVEYFLDNCKEVFWVTQVVTKNFWDFHKKHSIELRTRGKTWLFESSWDLTQKVFHHELWGSHKWAFIH